MTAVYLQQLEQILERTPISTIPSPLQRLGQLFPLGHRLYPLVKPYADRGGLLSVPWGNYQLLLPSRWLLPISTWYVFEGRRHIPEFDLIRQVLTTLPAGTIVEVGANIGYYLLELRHYTDAPIIAYEPIPLVFGLLKKNIVANQLANIDLRNRACGHTSGSILMNMGINSMPVGTSEQIDTRDESRGDIATLDDMAAALCEWSQISVPVVTLDEDLQDIETITLLKIDCEGFEYNVLLGAQHLLATHRPTLFIELHPYAMADLGHSISDIVALLEPHYTLELWDFQEESRNPIARVWQRYFPNRGVQIASKEEALAQIAQHRLPTFHLLARPR
ncbi:MAG: FkbM family methyltransferase [Cyanobacteria bacterium]|nr:FkbM family methyltransferase [Cyanobacteriota bacterium]MDW8199946.1 FkbM family methyltransferase [Cyanobacteriota bacterium SKYGB_h_bin112]